MLSEYPRVCPGEPTDAPPGSERKIRIMIERAARREPLFHPLDGCRSALVVATPSQEPWWCVRLAEDPVEAPESFEEELAVPGATAPDVELHTEEFPGRVLQTVGPI